jgi:hypothetical protein
MYCLEFPAPQCDLSLMVQATMPQALTANRLRDGDVVYWANGAWVEALAEAQMFADIQIAAAALETAALFVRDRVVVNPYLFDVRLLGGVVSAVEEREIIRAAGPTVRRDLGKQASHVPV